MCHLHGKSVILFAWSYHYFDIHNYILFSFGATPYGILPRSQITILFWLFLTSYMQLDRRIFQIHSKNYVPRKFKISSILKRKEYLRVVHIYPATSLVETSIWSIVSAPLDQHLNWIFHNLHGEVGFHQISYLHIHPSKFDIIVLHFYMHALSWEFILSSDGGANKSLSTSPNYILPSSHTLLILRRREYRGQ
jgi:hypothetical protein